MKESLRMDWPRFGLVMAVLFAVGCSEETRSSTGTPNGDVSSDTPSSDVQVDGANTPEDTGTNEDSAVSEDTSEGEDTKAPDDTVSPNEVITPEDITEADTVEADSGASSDAADTTIEEPNCPSYALESPVSFKAGSHVEWVIYDNQGTPSERKVTLVAPSDFDANATYPVFFLFHGSGGGDNGFVSQCKSAQEAGESFLCVVPLGGAQTTSGKNGWNLGSGQTPEDDVAFIHAIWASLKDEPYIDSERVFALGTSMGSAFSGNVLTNQACSFFTGVVQSATQLWVETVIESPSPMRVLMLHGENDNLLPIDGGVAFGTTNLLSVNESLAIWATHNACPTAGQPVETETEAYTRIQYEDCAVPTVLYRLKGQAHGTSIQSWYPLGLLRLALEVFVEGSVP